MPGGRTRGQEEGRRKGGDGLKWESLMTNSAGGYAIFCLSVFFLSHCWYSSRLSIISLASRCPSLVRLSAFCHFSFIYSISFVLSYVRSFVCSFVPSFLSSCSFPPSLLPPVLHLLSSYSFPPSLLPPVLRLPSNSLVSHVPHISPPFPSLHP